MYTYRALSPAAPRQPSSSLSQPLVRPTARPRHVVNQSCHARTHTHQSHHFPPRHAPITGVVAPTSDAFAALTGAADGAGAGGKNEAEASVTYVDETLRVTRVGKNRDQVFVYARSSAMEA
jgi:hypothetical protein